MTTMHTESHPDIDLLKAYALDSESPDYDAVRLHLAHCTTCRNEVDSISVLVSYHDRFAFDEQGPTLSEDDHHRIIDYVDGSLDVQTRERVAQLIGSNHEAMKAALHYAGHNNAASTDSAEGENRDAAVVREEVATESGLAARLSDWLGIRAPLWVTVSTTAIVVLALVTILPAIDRLSDSGAAADYIVASYQDNPVIQYRTKDVLPGIGFFSKAEQYSAAYNNVQVAIQEAGSGSRLMLKWPGVERAVSYTLRLQVFEHGGKKTIGELSTRQTSGVFDIGSPGLNRRYEWVLSGTTEDEKTFYTTGGFVISKVK